MFLNPGDKVLIVHRRLFEKDSARFFVGAVEEYDAGFAKVTGFTFYREMMHGHVQKKGDPRTKIVSVGSGSLFVYLLSGDLQIDKLHFVHSGFKLKLSDGSGFKMDLTEH